MHTIRITDLPASRVKTESFLGGTLSIISHSGLHFTETLLLENLPRLTSAPTSLLVAGNRTGAIAMAAAARFPECSMTCHAFDIHHARAILRNLTANRFSCHFSHDPFVSVSDDPHPQTDAPRSQCAVYCTTAIPAGPYDAALFMATPGTMTGELIIDQLEDIHENLAEGGTCIIACEAESIPIFKQIKAIFGGISILFDKNGRFCVTARKQGPLARRRDFSAAFSASVPGGKPYTLISLPGVFSHRRPDAGGLALAEIAVRELKPAQRVLDMGCGCGLVGLLLAKSQPDTRVTFIDSHARALAATQRNLIALGITDAELLLSDEGTSKRGFDLFAGNPPYYSDFRIAELFLRTAHTTLRRGGACLTVAKAVRSLEDLQRECFGNTQIISRRSYGVIKSIR